MDPLDLLSPRLRAQLTPTAPLVLDRDVHHHARCSAIVYFRGLVPVSRIDFRRGRIGDCCIDLLGVPKRLAATVTKCQWTLSRSPLSVKLINDLRTDFDAMAPVPGTRRLVARVHSHLDQHERSTREWAASPAAREALELAATLRSRTAMRNSQALSTAFAADSKSRRRMPLTLEEYCASAPVGNARDWRAELTRAHGARHRPSGDVLVVTPLARSLHKLVVSNEFLHAALAPMALTPSGNVLRLPGSLLPLLSYPQSAAAVNIRHTRAVISASDSENVVETAAAIAPHYGTAAAALRAARALERSNRLHS